MRHIVYIVEINRAIANDQYLLLLWVVNETSIWTVKGSVTLELVNDTYMGSMNERG